MNHIWYVMSRHHMMQNLLLIHIPSYLVKDIKRFLNLIRMKRQTVEVQLV